MWGFVHVCGSVHACVTLRWKHWGAGSPHLSLPVFRRSHLNSRLLRSELAVFIGRDCLFLLVELRWNTTDCWPSSLLQQLFHNPLLRFQIPDTIIFIKIFLPTAQMICIACQNREGTQIFLISFFFPVYWKPWGEMESNQNCISRQSLDSRTLSVNNRMSSLTIGLNQGSKYHYTQVHAAGSCCTWTYRSHPHCLLKFWTLKVGTDFCGCFSDMNNDIGKTQEFDMHFVEIQSNYKS